MNDLLDEVQEFQKQEFVSKFLQKYGKIIITICFSIVIATAIFVYWQNKVERKQEDFGLKFYNAQQSNDIKLLENLSKQEAEGFSDIAKINLAFSLSQNDYNKSQAVLMDIIKNSKYEVTTNYALFVYGINAVSKNDEKDIKRFVETAKKIKKGAFYKLISFVEILSSKDPSHRKDAIEKIKSYKNNSPYFINLIDIIEK